MDCYIIRSKTGNYQSLYYRDGNIYQREKTDDAWTYPEIIGADARRDFTVSEGKSITAVYQNTKGDIAVGSKGRRPRILLESKNHEDMRIHYIPYKNGARLLYSSRDTGGSCIAELHRKEDGWSQASAVDSYIPGSAETVSMGSENHLLFYIKSAPEFQLGYREISPYRMGGFKMLYSCGSGISDFSYAVTEEALHMAVITSGRRNGGVLYIRKDMSGISQPLILWNGPAELCICGIIRNKLSVWWKNPFGTFRALSYDMGRSFNRAEKCFGLNNCRKAGFINGNIDPDGIVFSHMLVDNDKIYEPLLV